MANGMEFGFGAALAEMYVGRWSARLAWKLDGEYYAKCCWMPPNDIPADKVPARIRHFLPEGEILVGGYFVMLKKAQDGSRIWQPGWAPTTDDLQAEDWISFEPSAPKRIIGIVR